jgi:hypothetical protein
MSYVISTIFYNYEIGGLSIPTTKRLWFNDACFHVTARGNHKEAIFRSDKDFRYYLKLLQEGLEYYDRENYSMYIGKEEENLISSKYIFNLLKEKSENELYENLCTPGV